MSASGAVVDNRRRKRLGFTAVPASNKYHIQRQGTGRSHQARCGRAGGVPSQPGIQEDAAWMPRSEVAEQMHSLGAQAPWRTDVRPVALPPGLFEARDEPSGTGSSTVLKTIGMVAVAAFAAHVAAVCPT